MLTQLYASRSWLEWIFITWHFLTTQVKNTRCYSSWFVMLLLQEGKKRTDLWCLHDCGLLSLTVGSVLNDALLNANQIYLLWLDICVSTNDLEWWRDRLYTLEHFINSCIHSNTASRSVLLYKSVVQGEKTNTALLTDCSVSGLSTKNWDLVRVCLSSIIIQKNLQTSTRYWILAAGQLGEVLQMLGTSCFFHQSLAELTQWVEGS